MADIVQKIVPSYYMKNVVFHQIYLSIGSDNGLVLRLTIYFWSHVASPSFCDLNTKKSKYIKS